MSAINFNDVVRDGSNSQLLFLIDSILNTPQLFENVVKRSYRHQLGFYKLVMSEKENGECLRLHWWDEMSQGYREDAHSHCASFVSRVVVGALTENIFHVTHGVQKKQYSYSSEHATSNCTAQDKGLVNLLLAQTVVHKKGAIYIKNAPEVHNVVNVEPGTISISRWEPRNRPAMVYKELHSSAADCMIDNKISEKELYQSLNLVKQRILRT